MLLNPYDDIPYIIVDSKIPALKAYLANVDLRFQRCSEPQLIPCQNVLFYSYDRLESETKIVECETHIDWFKQRQISI